MHELVEDEILIVHNLYCLEKNIPESVQKSVSSGCCPNHCTKMLFCQYSWWSYADNLQQVLGDWWVWDLKTEVKGERKGVDGLSNFKLPHALCFCSFAIFRWDPNIYYEPERQEGVSKEDTWGAGEEGNCSLFPSVRVVTGNAPADCVWGGIKWSKWEIIYFSLDFPLPILSFFWNLRS